MCDFSISDKYNKTVYWYWTLCTILCNIFIFTKWQNIRSQKSAELIMFQWTNCPAEMKWQSADHPLVYCTHFLRLYFSFSKICYTIRWNMSQLLNYKIIWKYVLILLRKSLNTNLNYSSLIYLRTHMFCFLIECLYIATAIKCHLKNTLKNTLVSKWLNT